MPGLSRTIIKKRVEQRITIQLLKEMIIHVKSNDPNMWGELKPRTFVADMVILTLYHDLTGTNYIKIEKEIDFGYIISHNSLAHNAAVIRLTLQSWANQYVTLGDISDWTAAARQINFKDPIGKVHLWIDSTDLRLIGKSSVSRKDQSWSYKCNSPGQRYMAISDAKGKIRYLNGGYSPKVYDGDWLKINKNWVATKLHGARIIADNHFEVGRNLSPEAVTFLVNYHETVGPQLNAAGGVGQSGPRVHLTKDQVRFNKIHETARARVESPFARLKNKFVALHKPWSESPLQQDYLVNIGCAVINCIKH